MTRIRLHIILVMSLLSSSMIGQVHQEWVAQWGGVGVDYVSEIVVDEKGCIYGVGSFLDTVQGLSSKGNKDVLVFKYTKEGNLVWAIGLGGKEDDAANGITIDKQGHLYITGYFRDTFYYGTDTLFSQGDADAFVAKIDTQGIIQWVKSIGIHTYEVGTAVASDALGNVYVTGTFEDSLQVDNQVLTSYLSLNNFVLKLNTLGDLEWFNSLGTPTFNNIQDLELDAQGNLYLIGYFRDVLLGDLGQLTSYGNQDAFLAKFDTLGGLSWWQKMGSRLDDYGFAICLDSTYIYMTGVYQDTAYFDTMQVLSTGEFDAFVAQYDTQGHVNWVSPIKGGDDSKGYDLTLTADGAIGVVGYFEGLAWVGQDSVTSKAPLHVPSDLFFAKYTVTGLPLSIQSIGGVGEDIATSIVRVDSTIYIAGIFNDNVNFDSTTLIANGVNSDIFLMKYQEKIMTTVTTLEQQLETFKVYPNPAENSLTIDYDWNNATKATIILYNQYGQVLKTIENLVKGTTTIALNYPSGIYFVHLKTAHQSQTIPLIITKK